VSFLQHAPDNYRSTFKKGYFYKGPLSYPIKNIYIVKTLLDEALDGGVVQANIEPSEKNYNDSFNHPAEEHLPENERLIIAKAKMRRGLALTKPDKDGLIKIAPVLTLKPKHSNYFDVEKLKQNTLAGMLYLERCEYGKESFVPIMRSMPIHINLLEPMAHCLNQEGLEMLDQHIMQTYDLFADYAQ
jgi:hypothetical protein